MYRDLTTVDEAKDLYNEGKRLICVGRVAHSRVLASLTLAAGATYCQWLNLTFIRCVHVPTCEEVSRVILGHVYATRDIHDDSVVAHLTILAEPNGKPALVGPLCTVVHLDISIFATSGSPVCQEEGAVLQCDM